MTQALRSTPLRGAILALGAKMTDFAGWEMALQYQGVKAEHQAVRQRAGMFDISHMGKFRLVGDRVLAQLQALVPTDLGKLSPGQAQYTVLLNADGGIVDDIIVYGDGPDRLRLIVNAATTDKDRQWLESHLPPGTLVDESGDRVLIAVQGPEALAKVGAIVGNLHLPQPFTHQTLTWQGEEIFIARTGYTGEDGVEIMLPPAQGVVLWQELLKAQVVPCGLGARDTLRLEAAMGLYGQDMDDHRTPLEAGLGWLVSWEKGDFLGRSALIQQQEKGLPRRLVALRMEGRHIARHGYPVGHNGETIGEITSGTLSFTLGYPIALAYVPPTLAQVGQTLEVEIRGDWYPAQVVKKPFYRRTP